MGITQEKDLSIVYIVAGLSSRFGGRIKQLVQVGPNNETLIEVSMRQAFSASFNKIVFVVGEKTETPFKETFGDNYNFNGKKIPIFYSKQTFDLKERDKPWGTCDAAVCAKPFITEPFVVCNGDDLYGEGAFASLANWLRANNSPVTLGYELGRVLPEKGSCSRAIYSFDAQGNITNLEEILSIEKSRLVELGLKESTLCSMNIWGLLPQTLTFLEQKVIAFKEAHKGDRKSECYLPVEISNLIKEKKISVKLLPTKEKWIGITNPEDEESVKKELAR